MDVNILGAGQNENIELQVDPTHQAQRVSLRPLEHVYNGVIGGHYGVTAVTGLLVAQTAASGQLFSVRFVSSQRQMVLLRLSATTIVTTVYSVWGPADFELYLARSYTANASGGATALAPTATAQMARGGNMGPSEFVSGGIIVAANTGVLTAGTQTLDSAPYSYAPSPNPGLAVGNLGEAVLYDARQNGKHPLVFGTNQGFVVRTASQLAGAAGTGVSKVTFAMEWAEVAVY